MSAISRTVSMIGWRVPRRIGRPGRRDVDGLGREAGVERRAAERPATLGQCRLDRAADVVRDRPDLGPVLRRQRADPAQDRPSAGPCGRGRRARSPRASGRRRRPRPRRARRRAAPPDRGSGRSAPLVPHPENQKPSTIHVGRGFGWLPGQAPFTASTIFVNVAASRTATSASVLRSSSISAFFRPATNAP